ncbi:MAG: hypothetical protein ACKERG_04200 [Candidatus Hodgkinia cicadicola]
MWVADECLLGFNLPPKTAAVASDVNTSQDMGQAAGGGRRDAAADTEVKGECCRWRKGLGRETNGEKRSSFYAFKKSC